MRHWTRPRWTSFWVHTAFVVPPLVAGTVSAYLLWVRLFGDPWLALGPVLVIDVLALTGYMLHILRVESPFVLLRPVLPFVSMVPLGIELYDLLTRHNDAVLAGVVAIALTAVAVALDWWCLTTIERLFISPVEATREQVRARIAELQTIYTQSVTLITALDTMAEDWQSRRQVLPAPVSVPVSVPLPVPVAVPQPEPTASAVGERDPGPELDNVVPFTLPERPVPFSTPRTVAVSAGKFGIYTAILRYLDELPSLHAATIAGALECATRTIEIRRQELVDLGVLERHEDGTYAMQDVRLVVRGGA